MFSGRLGLVLAMTSGVSIFNQCNEDGGEADIELGWEQQTILDIAIVEI